MNTHLMFSGVTLTAIHRHDELWFTSKDIAIALGYSKTNAITHIYNTNSDEFSPGMSEIVESTTSGNLRSKVRLFSLRGTHLIAMLARTKTAKEFRQWVLDLLDKESTRLKEAYIAKFNAMEAELHKRTPAATRQGNYSIITYFENGLPVACHPLMPGEVVMNPDSCLEHVIRSGYVVMPCDEAEKFTLGEIQKMIAIARRARDRWVQP
ncbi:TPA: BRO-N domain-containing protein [Enterobacter asburiae]